MRTFRLTAFLIFGCLAAFPAFGESLPALQAGAAAVEITPAAGTPLAGYGRRHGKPSTGVHDPLYARALALQKGNHLVVFVSCDLVLIDAPFRKSVLKKIQKQKPLASENLILAATHTHSGAGAIGGRFWERFIMGKFRRDVFEKMTDAVSEAALRSVEALRPASAESGEIRIDALIKNRMDERFNGEPQTLKMLRFKGSDGQILAHFILMAAHPTLLPAANFEFSSDFPGAVNRILEKENPGSVSVFFNGAAGDLRPHLESSLERFEKMDAYGQKVAAEISKISFSPVSLDGAWQAVLLRSKLPAVKARAGWFRVPSFVGGRVFPRHAFFQAVRLGDVLFFAFPGELSSETGRAIEDLTRAREFKPFVIGYANDYTGYAVPERYWHNTDEYEARASFYGPKWDWFIQKQALVLTDHLLSAEEKKRVFPPGKLEHQDGLAVLYLRGDPYHLGFEEGRLLKKEIRQGLDDVFRYFRKELPVPIVNRAGIYWLLDRAWKKMEPYISYSEYLQLRGVADGSGIPFKKIRRLHALPEVYPTFCTNGAYWGEATADGRLIAIRNLDWNRHMGIQKYAAVKFLDQPGLHRYVNIGYNGFTGVLSGMNEKGISVGQIGSTSADESLRGVPMPFLLKRILQKSASLEEAAALFKQSDLTRGYNYVIADASAKKAMAVEATHTHLAFFYEQDPLEAKVSYAVPVKNAVFRADTAVDPVIRDLQWASKGNPKKPGLEPPAGSAYEIRYKKQAEQVQAHYGKITPETAQQIARELAPGSNIQSVVYAFPDFYAANAEGDKKAAESRYQKFSFSDVS